jgi:DNA-binding XRE family transcriptional regulator
MAEKCEGGERLLPPSCYLLSKRYRQSRHDALQVPKDTVAPLLKAVGTRVRRLREARELTKSELARRADVDRPALIALERGDRNVSILFLAKVAKALKVTPGSLLDD